MATAEAPIHDNVKQALVDGNEHSTALVMRSMRNTERVYRNAAAEKVIALEAEFPGDFGKIADLVKGSNYRVVFQETGDLEKGVWSAGTVMGLIEEVMTCEDLCSSIVAEAEEIIQGRLAGSVVSSGDDE